jgi:sigma-B regulation protein RsbU (phosphoserine phosphatase)
VENAPVEDLEDLYENAPCGYLSMVADGRIFKANAMLAGWTGFTGAELVGKRIQDLLTVGSRIFYETHTAPELNLQGFVNEAFLELRTASGDILPVLAFAVQRRDPEGLALFTRLAIVKAGERRRYEQQLIEARNSADSARKQSETLEVATQELLKRERETSELREQFIAVLGHDLRNPLASISGGARLLSKEALSERGKFIVEMVQGSVVRMSGLIDNVLDFARGRLGGGIILNRVDGVELGPVLQQVVDELRVGVQDHEILTDFALTQKVNCDPSRLAQMVSNLIGNALVHGAASDPVHIYAATNNGELEISVVNSGVAIPPQTMDRLFQPFFRGEVRASLQGLGLGLHIASEIAAAHGGTLSVHSSDEETRFTFLMNSESGRSTHPHP